MKAEHTEIEMILSLARTGAALEKYNKGKPWEKQIFWPIEDALDKITPAWRFYTEDIYCPDNFHDLMDCYARKVHPEPGAVIVSQWGDCYTIEEADAEAGLILEIVPGVNDLKGSLFFDLRAPGEWIKVADLGRYCGEMQEIEGGCRISGDLATEAGHRLTQALETGGPCMMPPTDWTEPEEHTAEPAAPDLLPDLEQLMQETMRQQGAPYGGHMVTQEEQENEEGKR